MNDNKIKCVSAFMLFLLLKRESFVIAFFLSITSVNYKFPSHCQHLPKVYFITLNHILIHRKHRMYSIRRYEAISLYWCDIWEHDIDWKPKFHLLSTGFFQGRSNVYCFHFIANISSIAWECRLHESEFGFVWRWLGKAVVIFIFFGENEKNNNRMCPRYPIRYCSCATINASSNHAHYSFITLTVDMDPRAVWSYNSKIWKFTASSSWNWTMLLGLIK